MSDMTEGWVNTYAFINQYIEITGKSCVCVGVGVDVCAVFCFCFYFFLSLQGTWQTLTLSASMLLQIWSFYTAL